MGSACKKGRMILIHHSESRTIQEARRVSIDRCIAWAENNGEVGLRFDVLKDNTFFCDYYIEANNEQECKNLLCDLENLLRLDLEVIASLTKSNT